MNTYDKEYEEDLILFKSAYMLKRNKIKLVKDNYNNIKIKFHKKLISVNNKKDLNLLKDKIKNYLLVMNSKCKNFDPTIFYKNFPKTLFNIKGLDKKIIIGADGNIRLSKFVNALKLDRISAIYHELLHLSSLKNDKKIYSPLNEGYTQLLEERYFKEAEPAYYFETQIMKIIELIYGEDELEKLYFSGEFYNLYNLISKDISSNDLNIFYENLNQIFKIEEKQEIIDQIDKYREYLNRVFEILLHGLLSKSSSKVFENPNLFKEYFCISGLCRRGESKYIIDSFNEDKFDEIIEQYKKENYRK